MRISERLLKKWRQEALLEIEAKDKQLTLNIPVREELNKRILFLTQELQDQHLLRKAGKNANNHS